MKRASFAEHGLALLGAAVAWGCAQQRPAPGEADHAGTFDSLVRESRALEGLFSPLHLLLFAGVVVGALASNALLPSLLRLGWRLGFDRGKKWLPALGALRVLVAFIAALVVLRSAFRIAPGATGALALTCALAVVVLSGLVPNWVTGVGMLLRRRIRVGDRVRVGAHEGVVRALGLGHLWLENAEGATLAVPNRVFSELPVAIERARNSVPVRVRLTLEQAPELRLLEAFRHVATLSPYRAPRSPLDVSRAADDERQVNVEIQTWSAHAQRDARVQLELALRQAMAQRSAPERPPANVDAAARGLEQAIVETIIPPPLDGTGDG